MTPLHSLKSSFNRRRVRAQLKRAVSPLALATGLIAAFTPHYATAQVASTQLPGGGSIAGGTGTINAPSGASLTIDQTSARMAINWSSFDIGSAATVTFNQPSTSSVVLNRVVGGNPTQIFGHLNSNGQVFLVNTNGMIFGSTAQINVGGLVASTLNQSPSNFMSGVDVMDAGANTVALMSNGGTITAAAGGVTLLGGKVVNSGTITASVGSINLAAADKVTLTFESSGFGVVVDKAMQLQLDVYAVDNSGSLIAPGGAISLQASAVQGIFNQLINNSGTISAASISSGPDGSVSLVANGAGQVGIGGNGSIDVGEGSISFSTNSAVQQGGVYTAGSLGGSIGGYANFTGANRISELGSLNVGGGLSLTTTTDLTQSGALSVGGSSSFSLAGQRLTLENAGNTFGGAVGATASGVKIVAAGNLSMGALTLGANSELSLIAAGALTLPSTAINTGSADLRLSSGGTLTTLAALSGANVTLSGTTGIAIGHDINASGTLGLSTTNSAISQTAGRIAATGVSTVQAGSGAITLNQANNDFDQAVNLTGGATEIVSSGALTLGSLATGSLTATSTGALNLGSGTVTGALTAQSNGGAITQSTTNALTVTGTSVLDAGAAAITLTTAGNHFGQAVSLTGGTTQIADSGALTLGTLATGALTVNSSGALNLGRGTVTGALVATSNGGAISQSTTNGLSVTGTTGLNAGAGAITLTTADNDFGQAVTLTGGATSITNSGNLILGAANVGALTATGGTGLRLTGVLNASDVRLAAGDAFINDVGAGAINISSGRWLIYLNSPTDPHQFNGLDSHASALWNTAALGTVAGTGNRYVFAYIPLLHVTSLNASKTYGQTPDLSNNYTITGLMSGVTGAYQADTLGSVLTGAPTISSLGASANASVAGGPYAITVGQGTLDTSQSGYGLNLNSTGVLTVDKAGLTITATNAAKTYGQTPGLVYGVSGLVSGDAVTSVDLTSAGSATTATVGDYTITAANAGGAGLSNYDITYVGGVLTVGKAGLTITANNAAKTYGQGSGLAGYGVSGLVNGDAVTSVDLASAGSATTATVGDYTITAANAGGAGLSNYDITYVGGVLTVGKAGLTITANNAAKTYGQGSGLAGYGVSGLVNGDAVTSVDLASAGSATTATVGDYTITAANAGGAGLSNYDITYVGGVLTVGKAGLTITANNAAKTYGQGSGLAGYGVSGLVNGDAVTSVDLASAGSATTATVGDYTITAANAGGAGLSNYDITYVGGVLTVGKAGLTITASDEAKRFGETARLDGYSVAGLVNGDVVSSVSLTSEGAAADAARGDYVIDVVGAGGTGLSNYDIVYVDGVLKVEDAVSASDARRIASVARAATVLAAPVEMLTESEEALDAAIPPMTLPDKCEGLSSRGCDTQQGAQGNTVVRMQ
jgi:filamentous hemagglutinin family protein